MIRAATAISTPARALTVTKRAFSRDNASAGRVLSGGRSLNLVKILRAAGTQGVPVRSASARWAPVRVALCKLALVRSTAHA